MQICRRSRLFICAGLATLFALTGCGSSSTKETVPATVTIFSSHSLIFRNNSAMTMGYNQFGQLGDGTLTNRASATLVPGLGHLSGGAVGSAHTLVFSNHTSVVKAWGYNGFGQLGDPAVPTTAGSAYEETPVNVQLSGLVSDVAAGAFHSLAIAGDKVWAWGYNGTGAVGNGIFSNIVNTPYNVLTDINNAPLPGKAVQVAGGGLHSLAIFENLTGNRSVYAWGSNSHGQIGFSPYSSSSYPRPKKVRLAGVVGRIEAIAAGNKFSLALEVVRDGGNSIIEQRLWGWGYGAVGQLGVDPAKAPTEAGALLRLTPSNQSTAYSFDPVRIFTVTGAGSNTPVIKDFSAGLDHVLLLLGNRDSSPGDPSWTVQALGFNFYGQLGNNKGLSDTGKDTSISSFELVHVFNTANPPTPSLIGVTDILAIGDHSLAMTDGYLYGWGNNNMGQLGSPASTSRESNPRTPVKVGGFR